MSAYYASILQGALLTVAVSLAALAVSVLLGLLGAAAKLSGRRVLAGAATAYTTLIRGIPELVLMLLVFYGGQIMLNTLIDRMNWDYVEVSPFAAGTATLGFIFGAYLAETFRGAILAVPRGQLEAGYAFGLRRRDVVRRILLPQMVRHALPGFTNNWLVMVKATALVSIIGLDDMMHRAGLASAATNLPFTFYAAIAAIYLAITTASLLALKWLEHRFSTGVRRGEL